MENWKWITRSVCLLFGYIFVRFPNYSKSHIRHILTFFLRSFYEIKLLFSILFYLNTIFTLYSLIFGSNTLLNPKHLETQDQHINLFQNLHHVHLLSSTTNPRFFYILQSLWALVIAIECPFHSCQNATKEIHAQKSTQNIQLTIKSSSNNIFKMKKITVATQKHLGFYFGDFNLRGGNV